MQCLYSDVVGATAGSTSKVVVHCVGPRFVVLDVLLKSLSQRLAGLADILFATLLTLYHVHQMFGVAVCKTSGDVCSIGDF